MAKRGPHPSLATLPPDRLPTGEANLCPLATHRREPLSGHKGEAGLRLLATYATASPSPAPYWPQRGGHRREAFAPPPSLATYWPLTGHPGRPPTGQRGGPDWPPDGGSLRPALPRLATYSPSPTGRYRPSVGRPPPPLPTGHLLATPGPPPLPRLSGSGGLRDGEGAFRVQRGPIRCGPCALYPFWGPLPHFLPDSPTDWRPQLAKKWGLAYPYPTTRLPHWPPLRCPLPSPTGWPKGGGTGHLWPKGWG